MRTTERVHLRINGPGLLTVLVCLLAWEAAIRMGVVQYDYLPAPSAIAAGLAELATSGQLAADVAHTLLAVFLGWSLAVTAGICLGLIIGLSPTVRAYSLASIEVLRPLPGIAFVPVALLLFGFSLRTELAVIVLPALWPVLVNVMGGITGVHQRLFDVGGTFRLPRRTLVSKILLPAALPSILVGMRLSLTLALVLAIVAEMVGNPNGLGYAIIRDQQALRSDLMFANLFVIGVIGVMLNAVLITGTSLLFPSSASAVRAP
jgi:ABC-type nitrate/sulfonate/bicarbonate transport system permease component